MASDCIKAVVEGLKLGKAKEKLGMRSYGKARPSPAARCVFQIELSYQVKTGRFRLTSIVVDSFDVPRCRTVRSTDPGSACPFIPVAHDDHVTVRTVL